MPKFAINTIKYGESYILNICDENLVSKTLKEGNISIYIDPRYYMNRLVDESEVLGYISAAGILNLVGPMSVELVLRAGLGCRDAVKLIQGVPFLIVYKFKYSDSRISHNEP